MPPATWEEVYIYTWGDANLGSWPGKEWTTKDSEGWLFHVFDASVREVFVIFNNGDVEQTGDILLEQDACYVWNEETLTEKLSEDCSLSNIPFMLNITPEGKVYKTDELTITMTTIGGGDDATIYYTLDGSDPKSSAKVTYTAPITITGNVTLNAYATSEGKETDVQTHVYTYEEPQAEPITIAFRKPDGWGSVYLYSWNDEGATLYTGEWPGEVMTEVNEMGMYYHTFDASVKEVNFIFNNGSGVQSKDLYTDENACYDWDGKTAVLINCDGTDVENVTVSERATKYIQDGKLVIVYGDVMYNVMGQMIQTLK
jgi:hypothetical protein